VCVTSFVWFIKNMQKHVSFNVLFNVVNILRNYFVYEVCCMWGSSAVCSIRLLVLKLRKYCHKCYVGEDRIKWCD
jgi:hypothetical protein